MSTSSSTVLLFDVMSTLVYDPIACEIPDFFGLSLDELYANKHPTAWVDFERGEISEQTFYETYFPDRNQPIDGDGLRKTLFEAYRWLDGVEAIVEGLKNSAHPIHAFSNYPIWYRIIDDKLDLGRYLDWTFVSWKTGIRKPDDRAYRNAASTLDVSPKDCLFVDDRGVNCRAAHQVGMDAIEFENAQQLRRELSARDLL